MIAVLLASAAPGTSAEPGAFPVRIEHAFGSTTISAEPQRVLTLGWSAEDVALALGKQPIWMPRRPMFASGIVPWNETLLQQPRPELFSGIYPDFEEIARLKPDAILAVSSGLSSNDYRFLSRIAPTIVYRTGPWRADWIEQTQLIGAALGQPKRAEQLIADVSDVLDAARRQYPVLEGRTFAIGTYFNGFSIYLAADPRVEALRKLGLELSPSVKALSSRYPRTTMRGLSAEEMDRFDADILIMWYNGANGMVAERQPLFRTLPAVQRGSYVALSDKADVWAVSALSVLSIPYEIPKLAPRLAQAARLATAKGSGRK